MKTIYGVILIAVALLVFGCTQKVNAPADVQAIKNMDATYDNPFNAGNAEGLVSDNYTNDAVRSMPNAPSAVGKNAIRASYQKYFDQLSSESRVVTEDVRVSGDLAVAKGTYEIKSSLKAGGYSVRDKGKWVAVFQRQADGSWKAFWDISNSDLPVADALPLDQEELALLQIEREWGGAVIKKDAAWLDKTLANEWSGNIDGQIEKKAQILADLKSGAYKVESMTPGDMRVLVFGDTAVVHSLGTEKSSTRGKDTSGQYRWTDIFAKRDGRWQCVASHANKVG